MYRSLLVPLDGSPFGEHALPIAVGIARRRSTTSDMTLQIVHVHVPFISAYVEGVPILDQEVDAESRKNDHAYLEALCDHLASMEDFTITCNVLEGPVVDTLAEHVAEDAIGLVVLTTHGRGGLSRMWLGSVADDLLHRITVPLLLVRPPDTQPDLSRERTFRHMLIPLDGSALAEEILEPAIALGTLMEAEYTLLYVVQQYMVIGRPTSIDYLHELEGKTVDRGGREAQRYLDGVAQRLQDKGLHVRTRVITAQNPALAILSEARHQGCDLIAMATHGRGGLSRMIIGSVSDKVIRGADMPVLLYRPRDTSNMEVDWGLREAGD